MKEWYFAYGSNMWIDQMVERTGPLMQGEDGPRKAFLPNYRLAFNVPGDNGQVFANVVCPGDGVIGVLYRCSPEALRRLDEFEFGYERRRVQVTLENGEAREAFIYIADGANILEGRTPSAEYVRRILAGARQHRLPESLVRELEALLPGPR